MQFFPASLQNLADQFARLPGVGGKTAQRLAFYVLEMPTEEAQAFADAILEAKRTVHTCPCAPSAPTTPGTTPPSVWWQSQRMSLLWSAPGSTGGFTTCSTV